MYEIPHSDMSHENRGHTGTVHCAMKRIACGSNVLCERAASARAPCCCPPRRRPPTLRRHRTSRPSCARSEPAPRAEAESALRVHESVKPASAPSQACRSLIRRPPVPGRVEPARKGERARLQARAQSSARRRARRAEAGSRGHIVLAPEKSGKPKSG